MTVTTHMSVSQALAELKVLDKRINSSIAKIDAAAVGYCYPSTEKQKLMQEEFVKNVKAEYQSIRDLINRYSAIKEAIVISNATTIVKVADKEYTVAGAIEFKKRIEYEVRLVNRLNQSLNTAKRRLEDVQARYEGNLLTFLNNSVADKTQLKDNNIVQSLTEGFAKVNTQELLDPLNLQTGLGKLQEDIDAFVANVDTALTHVNVNTEIEVTF